MSRQLLSLEYVLDHWRPGSFDRTWAEEFADIGSRERIGELVRTFDNGPRDGLLLRVIRTLITNRGDTERMMEPVVLGNDGRVWAGHHRLWFAYVVPLDDVWCDVVAPGETRPGEAGHCAPPDPGAHKAVPPPWEEP